LHNTFFSKKYMSNTNNVTNFDVLSVGALYVGGKRFRDIIRSLIAEDTLEQAEIDQLRTLLFHLKTDGLTSEWIVNNENKNAVLKTLITAIETKLAKIDTTALTETSVLTNDNRNSVLKTRLDTAEGDIDGVENKTRFIVEASVTGTGDNTVSNYRTRVGPTVEQKGSALIELNMKNGPANELIGYTIKSNFNNDSYADNESIYSHRDGRLTLLAHTMRMQATEQIRIGNFAEYGDGFSTMAINIGGRGNKINIGRIDSQNLTGGLTEINLGVLGGTGQRSTNTSIDGNVYLAGARFDDLYKTDKFTWTQLGAFIKTIGIPAWVVSFALTSAIPNFEYSDCWVLKDGGFGTNKKGDVATSNDPKINSLVVFNSSVNVARLTPIEGTFVASGTLSKTTLNGSIRNSVFLDGGGDNKIAFKHHNISASDITDWAVSEANDKVNVIEIGGNSGILVHQGASNTGTPLQIINSCNGSIKMSLDNDGTKGGAKPALEVMPYDNDGTFQTMTRIGFYPGQNQGTGKVGSYQLEVNQELDRDGIAVAKTDIITGTTIVNKINANSINTPGTITGVDLVGSTSIITPTATATSLVINGNYTGNTDARLYKNADNKLMWNGAEVGAGGVSSGGITYMINVASNITNPSPSPTETIITAAYSGNPQRTITQAITANTAYYIAKYTTEVFDEVTNPVLTGLQQLNQYIAWNSQAQTGQLYGQLWFQATAVGFGTLYQRTYASPVTTTPATFINGTPIPTPKGLYNIKFQRVVFPNINVVVTSGLVVLRYRVEGLVSGSWTTLTSMDGLAPEHFTTASNLTITLDEFKILNQTTPGATAVRLVLFIASGTGTISQTSAGGADLAAYSIIGLGENTPALFRTMLYDGTNAKITIPYSTTPTLVEYDLAIDAPYNVSAFASPTLSTDLYFIQPAGGFANHAITLYFNEGSISHYHSTISPTQTTLTLAQVLNSGATASQPINMNTNKISGITALEGAANGNWNVKEITAGTGISVSPTNGNYTIQNVAPVQDVAASTGIQIGIMNNTATIYNNAAVQDLQAGTGISIQVDTATRTAVITNTNVGATAVAVAGTIRNEHQSLYEVGALPRKPDYWAKEWSVADSVVRSHLDIYVSVDGKIIVSATGDFTIRYSTDYGTTWNNATGLIGATWTSICGTSNGSKLFAFGRYTAQNLVESLVLYTSSNQGASWTQITSSAFTGLAKVNRVRCSGDGTYLLASDNTQIEDGRILYSTNGGTTWARQAPGDLPSGRTEGVAMSRSGAIQYLTWINNAGDSSRILRSIDYGFTWSEVFGHVAGGNWTRIETDATGRFVYATRYVNINSPYVEAYRSDDYGATWVSAGINSVEDIWVSGTGQFVAGVSNPQAGGISYVVYSTDYGRTFTGVNMTTATGSGTTYRTINGSADGSILVLGSVNSSEGSPSYNGDGLLRITRSGVQNIYDILQEHNVLWYITNIKSSSLGNSVSFPINATYGNINFDTHNIEYEIEINWDRHTFVSPSAHLRMGFNGIDSEGNIHSANTTWLFMLEHATATIHAGNQGAIGYNQHFNNRFYCGYSALQGTGELYRYKTLLTGQLGVQRRKQAQTADLGSYSADWSLDSRTLTNRFTSDTYIIENTFFSASAPDRSRLFSQTDFDNGHHCISGTAIWELTDAGAWEVGGGGALTALKDGIKNINLSFIDNPTLGVRNRSFDISARFWRVRK
jgi:hypothetical protein